MRRTAFLPFVVLAATPIAPRLLAQAERGALVRVSHDAACCENPVVGTLVRATDDSLWIDVDRRRGATPPVALPRASVRRVERGEQIGARMLVGTAVGLLVGVVGGAALGAAGGCGNCDGLEALAPAVGAMVGAPVGAVAGFVIGAFFPHYRWEDSDVPARIGIGPLPTGLIGLRVSLGR